MADFVPQYWLVVGQCKTNYGLSFLVTWSTIRTRKLPSDSSPLRRRHRGVVRFTVIDVLGFHTHVCGQNKKKPTDISRGIQINTYEYYRRVPIDTSMAKFPKPLHWTQSQIRKFIDIFACRPTRKRFLIYAKKIQIGDSFSSKMHEEFKYYPCNQIPGPLTPPAFFNFERNSHHEWHGVRENNVLTD